MMIRPFNIVSACALLVLLRIEDDGAAGTAGARSRE